MMDPREIEVLDAIVKYMARTGMAPTVEELMHCTSLTCKGMVTKSLRGLVKYGYISTIEARARSIKVLKEPPPRMLAVLKKSQKGGRYTESEETRARKAVGGKRAAKSAYDRRRNKEIRKEPRTEQDWRDVMEKIAALQSGRKEDPLHDGHSLFRGGRVRVKKIG